MNIVTNESIKRRGIAAVEDALRFGPVHLFKRNRAAGKTDKNRQAVHRRSD